MPQASILLAEPDPGVADLLAEMLAEMGHRPRQAGEDDPGREAEASPDLVIVGVGAEGPDGALVRAGRLLRGGEVPLLWLAEPEDLARLRKHPRWGDAAGLAKPFSQHDLQAAVSLALFRGELQGRLRRSEAQFRTLAENSPDIILRLDEDLDLLYANPAAARLWGWPAEQVEDLAWEELVLPPPLEHFLPARQRRVLASGEPLREQVSVRGPRGTVILDWQMIPEPGPGGAVASVLHSARDITELKAAEADLHRKEARLAHALEATSDGMWEWDLVTSEVYFSPRYLEMIGFKPGELREVHQTWVGLIHPDDRQRVIDHVGRHIRNLSSGFNIEFRFKTKGGPYIWVMARGKVIQRDDQGQALRLIGTHVDITRSKEVEAALRQSEAMWSKVFQRSPVWITIATLREGRILEVNDAFCRISGFSRSEAVGRTVDELGLWPDPELRDDYIALVKEQGAFTEKEVQFKVRDGSLRTLLWSCESMELGGITCTLSVITDITEIRRTQESLRESEEKYRRIVETAGEGIWMIDAESQITFVNQRLTEMLGWGGEEMQGASLFEFLQQVGPLTFGDLNAAPGGSVQRIRNAQFRRKNGSLMPAMISATPILDREGFYEGALGMVSDFTDIQRAQEALEASEDRFRQMAEAIDEIFWLTNADRTRLLYANPAFERIFGRDPSILADRTDVWLEWIHPEDRERVAELWREGVPSGDEFGLRIIRPDGEVRWLRSRAFLVHDDSGQVVGMAGIAGDVTARREAELKARQHQEQLLQASKLASLGTLVSGVAHEINNPNTFIMTNAPLLEKIWRAVLPALEEFREEKGHLEAGHLEFDEVKEMVPQLLEGIMEGSRRVKRIVRNLKDFARQEPTNLTESVNLNQVVGAALILLANLIKKSTDHFTVEMAPDLPLFKGSTQRVEQVVINLVVNACQALRDKAEAVTVVTRYDHEEPAVVLEIGDQGEGIHPDHLSRIMDPFFTTKREARGTGLGLSITSTIVREHGGSISFDSQLGGGTTVSVRFPLAPPLAAGEPTSP